MSWHALIFEVNSIQSWIFGSGKLRAIVGGSRLVSGITGELLDATLDVLPDDTLDSMLFARKAGGAFIVYSRQSSSVSALKRAWPLVVSRHAPGLSFSMGCGSADTVSAAHDRARQDMAGHGSLPWPELPAATPVMERCRRTGRAAVSASDGEPVDAIMRAQLAAEAAARRDDGSEDIASRLAKELGLPASAWPRDMEPDAEGGFPYLLDGQGQVRNRYVALIHADGNGLGQILQKLEFGEDEPAIKRWREFSDALEQATFAACLEACAKVLLPGLRDGCLPARPILLGGDDLSFIVRADLAPHFTRTFLAAFERETTERLSKIEGLDAEGLTACAGIAYLRSNQPFYMGMDLAEELCDHAKKQVREALRQRPGDDNEPAEGAEDSDMPPMYSALCQHRCTDSMISDWESILAHSLTLPAEAGDDMPFRLSMETWALQWENEDGFPPYDALLDLLAFFEKPAIARGPARRLMGLSGLHPSLAGEKYQRWLEMLGKLDDSQALKEEFLDLLHVGANADQHQRGPYLNQVSHWASPIPEALSLMAMGVSAQPPQADEAIREETP